METSGHGAQTEPRRRSISSAVVLIAVQGNFGTDMSISKLFLFWTMKRSLINNSGFHVRKAEQYRQWLETTAVACRSSTKVVPPEEGKSRQLLETAVPLLNLHSTATEDKSSCPPDTVDSVLRLCSQRKNIQLDAADGRSSTEAALPDKRNLARRRVRSLRY